jgi:uncharacterized protein (UPF0276 family)
MPFTSRIPLAVNYSPETEALLNAGQVALDYYKLPDWPDLVTQVSAQFPCYVHFTLAAGLGQLDQCDWAMIARLKEHTRTPFVNLHLVAPKDLDASDPRQVETVLRQAEEDVREVGARVGMEQVILENTPISGPADYYLRAVVTPQAICRVVRSTGCGLLLDLAHARLVARDLGLDEREYLAALPVECLRELHITGIGPHEGRLVDHLEMQPEDWALLDWALAQMWAGRWSLPGVAAFEYGGIGEIFRWRSHKHVLAEQIPQLYRRLQGVQ